MHSRALSVRFDAGGKPATVNEAERSVEVIGATETAVPTYDWDLGTVVDEILLMSGCRMPASGQLVLLDTHSRYDTASVIGSYRDLRIEGDQLLGQAIFTSQPEGEGPFVKLREGHLTDFSIGYRVNAYTRIEAGKTAVVEGRSFTGPALVSTDWEPRELSICPIGADPNAKARGAERSDDMNKRLREILEARGLPKDATEDQAWAFMQTLEVRSEGAPGKAGEGESDKSNQQEKGTPLFFALGEDNGEGVRAERERTREIMAMGKRFDCPELAEKLITECVDTDKARAALLDHLERKSKNTEMPGYQPSIELGATERDKFRAAMGDALALRAGLSVEKPVPGAAELRGYTLREVCREALRMAGQPISANPMEMVGRALTTTDLPVLLGNVANLSLMEGYAAQQETYVVWVDDSGTVSDFKIHTMARAGESDDLEEIPEAGEYKYGSTDETKETYQIAKFGKLFAITREAVINDNLGSITDTSRQHGEAAGRKIGDLAYAVLIANGKMGDGKALFHADHGNLMSAGALSVATLGAGETAMQLQKDIRGKRRLNIQPQFLLSPVSKKTQHEQFFLTQLIGGANNQPNLTNPYYGEKITRVYEPRLDDDSTSTWYLAGPKGKTVRLFFLNGVREPYLETRQGWSVDGTEYKVRLEAGAKAVDWRALQKNPG
jgi:hypothetical protein